MSGFSGGSKIWLGEVANSVSADRRSGSGVGPRTSLDPLEGLLLGTTSLVYGPCLSWNMKRTSKASKMKLCPRSSGSTEFS